MRKAATLTELLVVVAIIATIIAMLFPLFLPHSSSNPKGTGNNEPPVVLGWILYTRQHDRHWWVIGGEHFVHHPDCPCLKRHAEAVE